MCSCKKMANCLWTLNMKLDNIKLKQQPVCAASFPLYVTHSLASAPLALGLDGVPVLKDDIRCRPLIVQNRHRYWAVIPNSLTKIHTMQIKCIITLSKFIKYTCAMVCNIGRYNLSMSPSCCSPGIWTFSEVKFPPHSCFSGLLSRCLQPLFK